MQRRNIRQLAQGYGWEQERNRQQPNLQEAAQSPRARRVGRSLTPTFDKLTYEQVEALADPRQPLPPGVTPEQLVREAGLLWLADCLAKQGRL